MTEPQPLPESSPGPFPAPLPGPGPELVPLLAERLPRVAGLARLSDRPPTPEEFAAFQAYSAPVPGYQAPQPEIEEATVDGPHGPIPVRIYRPADQHGNERVSDSRPACGLVWAHGGAFRFGDLNMPEADVVASELAARAGAVVVSVDYRLCNDGVHFPVPHDDVRAVFRWAAATLPVTGGWAIGGASAGGNLAAGVSQRLRDEGTPPSASLLAYPVVHDPVPQGDATHQERVARLPAALRFSPEATEMLNRNYLGDAPSDTPYAFPALGHLDGLPPTHVVICEYDDLAPSGLAYAEALRAAGVTAEELLLPGVTHGHLNIPGLPEALDTLAAMAAFLTRHAAPSEPPAAG